MAINSAFLSGWEYNRILCDSPFEYRQSALPAEVLWNGAAQFWLFERVYCSRESLEGEVAAAEALDWATGRIFQDLSKRGYLETFDWSDLKARAPLYYEQVTQTHTSLRQKYDEKSMLALLGAGDAFALESIKVKLLAPILDHLKCVKSISPNSIVRWTGHRKRRSPATIEAVRALGRLEEAARFGRYRVRGGVKLTDRPGTGLSQEELVAQRKVELTIERPLIPDLLSGKLVHRAYLDALLPSAHAYSPANRRLRTDYQKNIQTLERLRDAARRYLWKDLHEDWLPRLTQEPEFLPTFQRLLRDALMRAHFDPYLKYLTVIGITIVSGLVGKLAGAAAGIATGASLATAHEYARKGSDSLALFLQSAKAIGMSEDRK